MYKINENLFYFWRFWLMIPRCPFRIEKNQDKCAQNVYHTLSYSKILPKLVEFGYDLAQYIFLEINFDFTA